MVEKEQFYTKTLSLADTMLKKTRRNREIVMRTTVLSEQRAEIDRRLVRSFIEGDEKAFEKLYFYYKPRLLRFVRKRISDVDVAEDLVQEIFLRVCKHLSRFDCARKFSTWIYVIATNMSSNEYRNHIRRRRHMVSMSDIVENGDHQFEKVDDRMNPDEELSLRELEDLATSSASCLSVGHQEVFSCIVVEGRTYQETADSVNLNLGTVKSRMNRAREFLISSMGSYLQ